MTKEELKDVLRRLKQCQNLDMYDPTDDKNNCWECDFFPQCPFSDQKEFIIA